VTGNAALSILEGDIRSPASPSSASKQDVTTTASTTTTTTTTTTASSHSSTAHGPPVTVPKPVSEVLKVVYQTKCALVRVRVSIPQCFYIG